MNEEINLSSNGTQTSLNVPERGEMISAEEKEKEGRRERERERQETELMNNRLGRRREESGKEEGE